MTLRRVAQLFFAYTLFALLVACSPAPSEHVTSDTPSTPSGIEIKVVVVTMFEIGEDEGDRPGEFQLWKAGQKLTTRYPFEHSHHDIYLNQDTGVLGIVTGMGIARAAAAIMALGLDPRFDLRNAYWLVAGIAGVDPADASIGSAAWAKWIVDGDLAHHIDAREMPENWATGYFPLFANEPYPASYQIDVNAAPNGEAYRLNTGLAEWAFQLTKNVPLTDYPKMQALRDKYEGYPNAQKKPFVLMGDHLAASTFWHGELMNQWANDWTSFWTSGEGNFVTSGMEDTGSFQSLVYLDRAGKVDKDRFMVVRTASNYAMQPPGLTAAENLALESSGDGYAGMQSALESAYTVGSKVVDTIVSDWALYRDNVPNTPAGN